MSSKRLSAIVVQQLEAVREQFIASTAGLHEGMAAFCPVVDMMTAAQHIAHAAQVIDWLSEGAFDPQGFNLDFDPQIARVREVSSLQAARDWFDMSIAAAFLPSRILTTTNC